MAYDENLVNRIRKAAGKHEGFSERKMFGGVAFLWCGKMCVGVLNDDLVVRVKPEFYEKTLSLPHVRPMDFTGRPMKGFVYVSRGGYKTDKTLAKWIKCGMEFVSSQSDRKQKAKRGRR